MSKDVKIELIYFKTNTDVSLEFGLHGNYPLRLLSVNTKSLAEFFHALKRAVSRSEIIIIIGGYASKEYLPEFLAKAIGRAVIECDNGDYGILSPGSLCLPAGAIPLVSKGKFGGFIMESGPQTIFSLTDDRNIRLSVTKDVIVNYITEHHKAFGGKNVSMSSQNDSVTATLEETAEVADVTTDTVVNIDQADIANEENSETKEFTDISSTSDNAQEEPQNTIFLPNRDIPLKENEILTKSTDEPSDINDNTSVSVESNTDKIESVEKTTKTISEEPKNITLTLDADEFVFNKSSAKAKVRHETRAIRVICIILSILVVLSTVAFAVVYPKINGKNYYPAMISLYNNYKDDPSAAFNKVKAKDNKVFTWLELDSIDVFHPAITLKSASVNSVYLSALPNGLNNVAGSLISTTDISPNISPKNVVIYGNASDGGIFEMLSKMSDSKTVRVGDIIKTADNRYQAEWSVLSYFDTSSENELQTYLKVDFSDSGEYIDYLNDLLMKSLEDNDVSFLGNEKLLILVGVTEHKNHIVAASLTSVRVLSGVTADNSSSSYTESTSSKNTSSETTVSDEPTVSEPDVHPEVEGEDFYGDSPDIILPPPVSDSGSSEESSSDNSKIPSSSKISTDTSSDEPSSVISSSEESSIESSTVSVNSSSETNTSSQNSSTNTTSSQVSSSIVSSTPSTPAVDPIYTWDKEFTITDSATGIKYTAKAVDMVAMIIEDEMSPTIDPAEAVIAQAIVKYNWLLHNNGNKNALDPNPTPQAKMYAEAAKGSVIMYGNTIAKTYCYAYSAGKTACYQDIWGGTAYPYLQSVDCPVDEDLADFITTTTYSAELISTIIKNNCGIDVSKIPKSEWLKPIQFDKNNLYCLKISIGGKEYNGRYLRETLLTKANTNVAQIRSTAYSITYNEANDTFTVSCKGYGHGVGLSQRGAKAYAKLGWTHEQIIAHFFPGTTIIKH